MLLRANSSAAERRCMGIYGGEHGEGGMARSAVELL